MAKSVATALSAAVLLFAAHCVSAESNTEPVSERALLLVHKSLETSLVNNALVKNQNFTVTYTIVNKGAEDALDVELRDDWPSVSFDVLSGSSNNSWPVITSGQEVSAVVVLQAKAEGAFTSSRAVVEYSHGAGEEQVDHRGYSSSLGKVQIFTNEGYKRATGHFGAEWATFLLFSGMVTALPFVVYTNYRKAAKAKTA